MAAALLFFASSTTPFLKKILEYEHTSHLMAEQEMTEVETIIFNDNDSMNIPYINTKPPLSRWEIQRREWTMGHKRYNQLQTIPYNPSHPALKTVQGVALQPIYDCLIACKPLHHPLPLDFVVTVLVF